MSAGTHAKLGSGVWQTCLKGGASASSRQSLLQGMNEEAGVYLLVLIYFIVWDVILRRWLI